MTPSTLESRAGFGRSRSVSSSAQSPITSKRSHACTPAAEAFFFLGDISPLPAERPFFLSSLLSSLAISVSTSTSVCQCMYACAREHIQSYPFSSFWAWALAGLPPLPARALQTHKITQTSTHSKRDLAVSSSLVKIRPMLLLCPGSL